MILILGMGKSGLSAKELLLHLGREVLAYDDKAPVLIPWEKISLVILSPGFPPSHQIYKEARKKNIPIKGEVELAIELLDNEIIGITGSSGKSTTTALTAHILNECGIPSLALGNIGSPITAYAKKGGKELLVLELSSYQIEGMKKKSLKAGVLLNLYPNHLDRYKTYEDYVRAKCRIEELIKEGGALFTTGEVAKSGYVKGKLFLVEGGAEEFSAAICESLGVAKEKIAVAIKSFIPLPHRLEKVAEIRGVVYYNDSKATNVESVLYAVSKLNAPIWLIAGGEDKGLDYTPWNVLRNKVKEVFLIGKCAEKIKSMCDLPCSIQKTLELAVKKAYSKANRGEIILLSPGCSSYDQFKNFEQRGEVFKQCVSLLAKGEI